MFKRSEPLDLIKVSNELILGECIGCGLNCSQNQGWLSNRHDYLDWWSTKSKDVTPSSDSSHRPAISLNNAAMRGVIPQTQVSS